MCGIGMGESCYDLVGCLCRNCFCVVVCVVLVCGRCWWVVVV